MAIYAPCACCGRPVRDTVGEYFLHNVVCDDEPCQAYKREQDERMQAMLDEYVSKTASQS